MEPINLLKLSSDQSPVVGFALVAHESISQSRPAAVGDGQDELEVPLRFYTGNLNMIRAELHKLIDDGIDALLQ